MALAQLDFVARAEVVHFLGPPGTGKSHLATALGVAAVKAGRRVYRATLAELIEVLGRAEREGRLIEKIRFLGRSSLPSSGLRGRARGHGPSSMSMRLAICPSRRVAPISSSNSSTPDTRRPRSPSVSNRRHRRSELPSSRHRSERRWQRRDDGDRLDGSLLTSNRGFAEWGMRHRRSDRWRDHGAFFGDPVVATALLDRLLHHAIVVQIEGASYRLSAHTDLIPEHTRSHAAITPPPAPKRRRRPPKNGAAHA